MKRNSFVFYDSFYKAMIHFKPEEQALCLKALCDYSFEGIAPNTDNPIINMFFELVKPQIDKNNKRYENGCKGAKFGKLGGNPNLTPKQPQVNPKATPKQPLINPKSTPNDNDNVNDNVNDNDKKNIPQTKQPSASTPKPVSVRVLNPQQRIYEYFAQKYYKNTGIKYLSKKADFVILADLIKEYGEDMVITKIDWLEIGCVRGIFWFGKDINSFTIQNLKRNWNEILPKLTEEQKKKEEERKKDEEMKKRVLENVRRKQNGLPLK